jgi:hypothetical protein
VLKKASSADYDVEWSNESGGGGGGGEENVIEIVKVNGTALTPDANKAVDITVPDVSGKEDKSNKVTSLSSTSTDTQYPSAKCVYDMIGDIETLLTSI